MLCQIQLRQNVRWDWFSFEKANSHLCHHVSSTWGRAEQQVGWKWQHKHKVTAWVLSPQGDSFMYTSKLDLLTDTTVCVSETSISGELKENWKNEKKILKSQWHISSVVHMWVCLRSHRVNMPSRSDWRQTFHDMVRTVWLCHKLSTIFFTSRERTNIVPMNCEPRNQP